MNTYLFAWNPTKWTWTDLEECVEQLELTGKVTHMWSVQSHKKIRLHDRAFLVRLGQEPKGIMGAGFVSSLPFLSKHWSGEDRLVPRVNIDFEVLLNPDNDPLLSIDLLNQGNMSQQVWTPQSSGIQIKPDIVDELEALWFDFLTTQDIRHNPFVPTDTDDQKVYSEGTPNQVSITRYERNPYARQKCIDHYGLSCVVCDFNFEDTYGQAGKDFIHVHHLTQVATVGDTYTIDPIKDLRPVCPNCHSIIHRQKTPYTIDEMKKIIKTPAANKV